MPTEPSFASLPLFVAGVLCVLGLFGLMRPSRLTFRSGATIVGLAGVGMLMALAVQAGGGPQGPPASATLCIAFATIAIAGAVRMVTHPRPVFAALYFILVVLASAALFLLMQAEFVAFALIIVYAGAILITYMFVLMLAQESPEARPGRTSQEDYDRIPREPAVAVVVGFFMLMVLSEAFLGPKGPMPDHSGRVEREAREIRWDALSRMPKLVLESARTVDRSIAEVHPWSPGVYLEHRDGAHFAIVSSAGSDQTREVEIPNDRALTNTRGVGMALVADFPVSLELAGVILLMAMFGAVVLARKQIELGDDERREAAGLRRLNPDEPGDSGESASWRGGQS
ncbi:MAG: NADH-quinone oxidoreductase subunit J [Phycisphaeraceae bacterium]|nr:NADH-quinone oxidoreductase subunit J [Phycisphaeraceae bacterium]